MYQKYIKIQIKSKINLYILQSKYIFIIYIYFKKIYNYNFIKLSIQIKFKI